MSRGNPNQYRLLIKIKELGFNGYVKHNQIHIEGVKKSPFYPDDVESEPTYGMTIIETMEWLNQINGKNDQLRGEKDK